MKRIVVLSVFALLLVGCVVNPGVSPLATPPYPADVPPDLEVPTLPAFLEMLAGPVGWVILGALFSDLCSKWAWYNTQNDFLKRGLILAGSVVVAVVARVALTYVPVSFWDATAEYWYILAGVVITYLGSQGWFQGVVKPARSRM